MYKAELIKNDKVIKTFEENSDLPFDVWKYKNALNNLKPKGELIKFYINNELQLGNW